MDDEQLRKEKYRCTFAGHNGLTVGDLFIRSKNFNFNRVVQLKQGEYLLTELLDFAELKKSRLTGALSKFIEKGWVTVENPAAPVEKREVAPIEMVQPATSAAVTEMQAGTVKLQDVTNLTATAGQPKSMLDYPEDKPVKVVEVVSFEKSRTVNSCAISESPVNDSGVQNGSDVFEKFNALRYFQKLKTIKETTDVNLLEIIARKSNYPQLVHNSKNRLRELSYGK